VYGKHEDVDLKPNGRHIPVTSENIVEYIHRIADFRLNKELRAPCTAFLSGFFSMVCGRGWKEDLFVLISVQVREVRATHCFLASMVCVGGKEDVYVLYLCF
jgi:hypothetical protein